ncbi:MAG TPA: tetratricopeptide repeat protein [Candidatus Acidoferrum sp.]|nr:tetratricopeptide repeat protein [Candidatus Acidoferrum sp.]
MPLDAATFIDQPKKPSVDPGATAVANRSLDSSVSSRLSTGLQSYAGVYRDLVLQPGDLFGGRYEILQLLGEGGMGSVYKAADRQIERTVALKLIRPDLASNPAILARFKQELLTAHQVTHKNVIRIYDMAEAEGVKFITMEFVEGTDLRHVLLDLGKLPPEAAVEIIRQVCLALDAAHSAGIIHRDLKPQNIMQDKNGRILVMDFGLARSVETGGMTQTGALLGTIEYMSPEQSMGKTLDQRSDLFAVGLIFYELLSGKTPFKAETAMASLLLRNQERAVPVRDLDESIPRGLSDIVSKCLERDLNLRYQSASEILADLDAWQGKRPVSASTIAAPSSVVVVGQRGVPWKWIAPGVIVLLLGIGGWVYRGRLGSPPGTKAAAGPEISLAILPFHNATSDQSIDWIGASLADMLSTDVGQSSHMRVVTPDRVRQILKDLRIPPNASIDPDMLRRIAELSNADTVVSGQYAKFGDQIQIDATLQDLKHNRRQPLKMQAASEKEIPTTVDGLAELIRKNLSLSSDVLKELKASAFQPSSKSVPALRDYSQSVQLLRDGKNLEAIATLQAAIKEDPQFALAYSRLAETDSALGYDTEAEGYSRKAVDLSQQLPIAEKYLIEANHARVMKDNKKAIEAYENLAKTFPDNTDVEYALGSLYVETGDYDKAREQFARILQSDPKNIKALWQMGVIEIRRNNPQAALDPLNKGISLAIQVDNQEQRALLLQAAGVAYRFMNRSDEAMRNYKESMEINRRLGLKRLLAVNLVEIGLVQSSQGKPDDALSSFVQALKIQKEIGIKKEVGDTLIDMATVYQDRAQYDQALQVLKESLQIQRDTGDENYQALCLAMIGDIYLSRGDSDNAFSYYQQSLQLREKLNIPGDIAESLVGLGAAYQATGQYDQAVSAILKAIDLWRKGGDARGAALGSYQLGLVFQYQGRLGAALSAMQDAVNPLRDLKERSRDMADALDDLGDTLAKAGRGAEADKVLAEAQSMARELKNDSLQAAILNSEGDVQFYAGNWKPAKKLYDQALRAASRGTEHNKVLISRLNLARVTIAEGHSQSVIGDLRSVSQEADKQGIKYLALESSVEMAAAMLNSKDYSHARQELDRALGTSEKLGLRLQAARIHYLLGETMRLHGSAADAPSQYRQTLTLLDEIKKDPGAEHVLERADLKSIYEGATRGSQ